MISCNSLNLTQFPTKRGTATKPMTGWDVRIMDDDDNLVDTPGKVGKVMIKLPCPPAHMDGLWGND